MIDQEKATYFSSRLMACCWTSGFMKEHHHNCCPAIIMIKYLSKMAVLRFLVSIFEMVQVRLWFEKGTTVEYLVSMYLHFWHLMISNLSWSLMVHLGAGHCSIDFRSPPLLPLHFLLHSQILDPQIFLAAANFILFSFI